MVAWQSASPLIRSVLLAGASGVAFGVSSVVTKAVLADFSWPGATAVGVLAVTGYLLGQASYRGGGLAAPLAMVSVANPVVAAIGRGGGPGRGVPVRGTLGVVVVAGLWPAIAGIGAVGVIQAYRHRRTDGRATARALVHSGPPSAVTRRQHHRPGRASSTRSGPRPGHGLAGSGLSSADQPCP